MGGASDTVKGQLPLISEEFPEVRDCHIGTINVAFEPIIIAAGWDHRTNPINWCGEGEWDGEVFDFLRVKLRFPDLDKQPHSAWMYIAHGSPHRMDPHNHEFLAHYIPGLRLGITVVMECDRPYIELPYTEWDMIDGNRLLTRTYVIQ
jgi:hypothetical protein